MLRRRGLTKQDFDLAIASIALEEGATLVSHDQGFRSASVPGLEVEDWLGPT